MAEVAEMKHAGDSDVDRLRNPVALLLVGFAGHIGPDLLGGGVRPVIVHPASVAPLDKTLGGPTDDLVLDWEP